METEKGARIPQGFASRGTAGPDHERVRVPPYFRRPGIRNHQFVKARNKADERRLIGGKPEIHGKSLFLCIRRTH